MRNSFGTSETQKAFDELKSKFSSAPVLAYPNRDLPFLIETDSYNFTISTILFQASQKDYKFILLHSSQDSLLLLKKTSQFMIKNF